MDIEPSRDGANSDLTSLLGSRICHDIISPLGAIGNGIELLLMSGLVPGPEVQLISESVAAANAKIRFFRIAFGAAAPGQTIARSEILTVLSEIARGGRLRYDWTVADGADRAMVKLAFLGLLCMESALPRGGNVAISTGSGHWRIETETDTARADPMLWGRLSGRTGPDPISPAQVQFALLPDEARRQGRMIRTDMGNGRLAILW